MTFAITKSILVVFITGFGAMFGKGIGTFIGWVYSYFSYISGPDSNSESASLYALEAGGKFGGITGLVVGGLIGFALYRSIMRRHNREVR